MKLGQLGEWLPRTFFIYATLPFVAFAQLQQTSKEASVEAEEPAEKVPDPVADASERAHLAFKQGNYQEAVAIYRQAYQQEPVSALLYNIAFIYDQHIRDRALARDYYRRYVNQPDTEPTSRLRAYERIAALDVPKPKKTPAPAPVKTVPIKTVKVTPAAPVRTPPPESTQRTWGYITLGLGGAALVAGTTLAFMTRSTHQNFEAASDIAERDDLADRGEGLALGADISFGAAAAFGVIGVVLVATSPDDTMIVPMSNGRVHGVGWTGSF